MTSEAPAPPHDPRPGSRLRGALMLPVVFVWAFGYMAWLMVLCSLAPTHTRRNAVRLIRRWGRVILKLLGIRVDAHGLEHIEGAGARIVLFNHVNAFDLVVLSSIWSEGCSVIYKREFHRIPMMGRLMRFFGMIPIDRANREAAVKTMHEAAMRIRDEEKRVFVAPEGTRSHDGRLGSFKKGPFHLALQTRVPVVPFVMRGIEALAPSMTRPTRTGVIRVDVLPPISVADWQRRSVETPMAEIRALFLRYLPDGAHPDDAFTAGSTPQPE